MPVANRVCHHTVPVRSECVQTIDWYCIVKALFYHSRLVQVPGADMSDGVHVHHLEQQKMQLKATATVLIKEKMI